MAEGLSPFLWHQMKDGLKVAALHQLLLCGNYGRRKSAHHAGSASFARFMLEGPLKLACVLFQIQKFAGLSGFSVTSQRNYS